MAAEAGTAGAAARAAHMFHLSWRYVPGPTMNPKEMILMTISAAKTALKKLLRRAGEGGGTGTKVE